MVVICLVIVYRCFRVSFPVTVAKLGSINCDQVGIQTVVSSLKLA